MFVFTPYCNYLLVMISCYFLFGGNTNRRHERFSHRTEDSESECCSGLQRATSQPQHTTRKHPSPPPPPTLHSTRKHPPPPPISHDFPYPYITCNII